jgi:glycosyltransferase involved in cell wall biosynthesis
MRISVIIPALNEEATIGTILENLLSCAIGPHIGQIIVSDDGSTDQTPEIVREFAKRTPGLVELSRSEKNQGKGAAVRRAFSLVKEELILIQDADLEYDPRDLAILMQPLFEKKADVVYGSRFLGGPHRVLLFWHYMGNRFLTFLSNVLNNLNLTDMETGYKAFRAELLKKLSFRSDGFGFEVEFTCKMKRIGCRFFEVPISYYGRTYEEGKKIVWTDGVRALGQLLYYRFFAPLS